MSRTWGVQGGEEGEGLSKCQTKQAALRDSVLRALKIEVGMEGAQKGRG